MYKKIILLILVTVFISCKTEKKAKDKVAEQVSNKIEAVSSQIMETAIIYEANIRQYSAEGTFDAFTKDIPEIKKLGVKIIWIMPIFPISETKRKATGGDFASKIKDETERKKALGSYYAVSSFTEINPEFGTIEDFRNLVKTAHKNGLYVILDWVPNHTGWDHTWLKTNPEFYTKGKDGKITHPLKEDGTSIGWDDVADLNYDSKELREQMLKDMTYWIEKENIDGFRCDVAGMVPLDFWQGTVPKLREKKDIFMLAEAWESELLKDNLFDMAYAWDSHHLMNSIAKGEKNAKDWDIYIEKINKQYEKDDILMNFVTNHDENSWNGTIKERFGNAAETMLALSYLTPGMPLIYSGQEYDLNHRLKFFEKDSIPKTKGETWSVLEKLGKLKRENEALHGGKEAASYTRINTDKDETILAFERVKGGNKIIFIANLSNESTSFSIPITDSFNDYMNSSELSLVEDQQVIFKPWEYKILID
ncbi:MAG: alpha-amylase [Flavobacteriaceae bacterium]|nr:alpha-amylase [Flavobacteriaceae bacterium]